MRFLSIVKSAENQGPPPQALMDAMAKLTEDSLRDGSLVQTGGLSASSTGARLRVSGGKLTVTDGPFAEAKEVIGGYWLIQVKSKAEAVQWASRCPAGDGDVIEVRQVQEMSDFPPDVQKAAGATRPGSR